MHTSARTGFTFWAGEPVVSLRGASFSPSRRLLSHAAGAVVRAEALYYIGVIGGPRQLINYI
jgi:hypothetical protein